MPSSASSTRAICTHNSAATSVEAGSSAARSAATINDVDIYTRSHVYLLEAVERLRATDPELAASIEIHLAGVLTDSDREIASACLDVQLHGYVTHAESIELMRTADLLFLPMQNLPAGTRATIVPGKTYEYLASGTPILAAVPDGDARDILELARETPRSSVRTTSPRWQLRSGSSSTRHAEGGAPPAPAPRRSSQRSSTRNSPTSLQTSST